MTPIPECFYLQDTLTVARKLLGMTLISNTEYGEVVGRIVETEAYLKGDPACHAFRGMTLRNEVMYGPPGRAYIYRSYGIHFMLNIVTRAEGLAEAVLIRAASPVSGIPAMRRFRERDSTIDEWRLAAGPGRLAAAFGITRELHNAVDITRAESSLVVTQGEGVDDLDVVQTTRIGITQGAHSPWRFYVRDCRSVSKR